MRCRDYVYNFVMFILVICKIVFEGLFLPLFALLAFLVAFSIAVETIGFSDSTVNSVRIISDLYVLVWIGRTLFLLSEAVKELKEGREEVRKK